MTIDQKIVLLCVLIAVFATIVYRMVNTPHKNRKETSRVYNGMSPVHPGEVILGELRELNMSAA